MPPHAARAIAHYQLFLNEGDEGGAAVPDAAEAYGTALDYLLASLRRAFTPGERAILQAVHGVREDIAKLRPGDTTDIIDAHVDTGDYAPARAALLPLRRQQRGRRRADLSVN